MGGDVGQISYTYDGLGRRLYKEQGGRRKPRGARRTLTRVYGPERHAAFVEGLVAEVGRSGSLDRRTYRVGSKQPGVTERARRQARAWQGDAERRWFGPLHSARSLRARAEGMVRTWLNRT